MDTATLIAEARARFNHNLAKDYLAEKYTNKLLVADQNGLWKADQQTIAFLNSFSTQYLIVVDTFGSPIQVNRVTLLETLQSTYNQIMKDWYDEWQKLESKR